MRIDRISSPKELHGNHVVWRYMGLDKFLDLLLHQSFFFCNATLLSDETEITVPPRNRKIAARHAAASETVASWEQSLKARTYVSCWSIGTEESYALWKIYLRGAEAGVAVRTTVGKLLRALDSAPRTGPEDEAYCARVAYADYLPSRAVNDISLITTKRPFYKYESELRLFVIRGRYGSRSNEAAMKQELGLRVPVRLSAFLDSVYVSPFAGGKLERTVEEMIQRLHPRLRTRIRSSGIRESEKVAAAVGHRGARGSAIAR